jgi:shikimate kinase
VARSEERGPTSRGTLWLVGMMGSGKSTVGPLVAEALGRSFVDLDATIAARTGREVPELVAADEPGFRAAEEAAVREVAGREVVVATGGGVILDDRNVAAMRASGVVVWLEAAEDVLASRLGDGAGRPLLGDDPRDALHRIMGERVDAYRSAAHCVVAAGGAPADVAERVVAAWRTG